jgi:hypothetical protein
MKTAQFRRLSATASVAVALGLSAAPALASPGNQANYPENPNACVGHSSTTANAAFQSQDPDKYRSDQARQDDGQPGRADSVKQIPCSRWTS